jgi:lipid-A-disaccharide synthase
VSDGAASASPHAAAGSKADTRHVFLIAGEHSGDALGAALMPALAELSEAPVRFSGIGGPLMQAQGLKSLFPLSDVAVMGPLAIAARLPTLLRRVRQAVEAVVRADPDILVIIDSPEFTHAIAKRVRRRLPHLPIVDYVSPSVWAWRPGRARRMRAYVDRILAILPFEPRIHAKLGGPPCTYVGHPLSDRLLGSAPARPDAGMEQGTGARGAPAAARRDKDLLLVLPGSRASEIARLMGPFGGAVARIVSERPATRVLLPTIASLRPLIEKNLENWPVRPEVVDTAEAKWQAFGKARAALAASGTVTLELALSRVPMAVAYRLDPLAASLRWLMTAHSVVLPNLILGENAFPEFIQERCRPDLLAGAVAPLLAGGAERDRQIEALDAIAAQMDGETSDAAHRAARAVLDMM